LVGGSRRVAHHLCSLDRTYDRIGGRPRNDEQVLGVVSLSSGLLGGGRSLSLQICSAALIVGAMAWGVR